MNNAQDPYGFPPPHSAASLSEELELAQHVTHHLRQQVNITAQVLVSIVETIGNAHENRFFGCDRCSECTIDVAKQLDSWLQTQAFASVDPIIVNFSKYTAFPRALVLLIKACAHFATYQKDIRRQAQTVALILTQLTGLSDEANSVFQNLGVHPERTLYFARIAAVLSAVKPVLKDSFGASPGWQDLKQKLDAMLDDAPKISGGIDDKRFREDRWQDDGHIDTREGDRRICGGGIARDARAETRPAPKPIYIIDFSKEYFLGVADEPYERTQRGWDFYPCQRELPFRLDFQPAKRKNKNRHFPVTKAAMQQCGRYYQLFRILEIEPKYYYHALCVTLPSTHPDNLEVHLVNTYDWPEVPSILR